jgi:hypothetical protein
VQTVFRKFRAVRNTDAVRQYSVNITALSLFILNCFDLNTREEAGALQTPCIVTFLEFYGISETEACMKLDGGTETCSHEYLIVRSKNAPVFMQLEAHS